MRQRLSGSLQHADDCLVGPDSHFLRDLRSVYIGAYRVKGDARLRVSHLGFKERRHQGGSHLLERMPSLLVTDALHGFRDLVQVTFQGGLQQGGLVGEILIKSSDRHAGSQRHLGRREPLLSRLEQNLNSRFENRVYARRRTGLNRRFTRF